MLSGFLLLLIFRPNNFSKAGCDKLRPSFRLQTDANVIRWKLRHMLTQAFPLDEVRCSTKSVDSLFSRLCPDLRKCHVCTFWRKVQGCERCTGPRKGENKKRSRRTPSIYFGNVGQKVQKGEPMRPHTDTNNECIAYKQPLLRHFSTLENRLPTVSVCFPQRLWPVFGWIMR